MIEKYLGEPNLKVKKWLDKNYFPYSTPFYFEALEDGHISLKAMNERAPSVSLLFSLDNKTWNEWNQIEGTNLKTSEKLFLKAKTKNSSFTANAKPTTNGRPDITADGHRFISNGKIKLGGNIMSLLKCNSYPFDKTIETNDACFYQLFYNCNVVDASELQLPAINLGEWCYYDLFCHNQLLSAVPYLPATKMVRGCYHTMYQINYSLLSCHEFPENITLAERCFTAMYCQNSVLQNAPKLTCTKLETDCYSYMFCGCSALTSIPELPATILADNCYRVMFWWCKDLSTPIYLPATNLAHNCYSNMFGSNGIPEIHYPKSLENDSYFKSMGQYPRFGASGAKIFYDI